MITDIAVGPAKVISFTGKIFGQDILGLFVPDGWWRNDNQLVSLTSGLLNEGISGYTLNWYFNLYLSDTPGAGDAILFCNYTDARSEAVCNGKDAFGFNNVYTGYAYGSFAVLRVPGEVNPVPVPAALPLLASGLGAMWLLGWRKHVKSKAI